ncbi:hypothetical protein WH47_07095 [Habropoda laboriosa]|uniref:SAP domain-containing protein n=1 Tax=Habropoda laboriosa TaxID=597456 RepID=A0A0L7QRR5_9HYME|nr:hypothetical protein WH47_07095 [Habropoda laboriosa]
MCNGKNTKRNKWQQNRRVKIDEKHETRQVHKKEKIPQNKIDEMRVVELRDTLKKMQLSTGGKKQELRNRLKRHIENYTEDEDEASSDPELNETIIAHRTEDESSESSEEDIESGTDDEDAADQERSDTRSDIVRMRARDRFTIRDVEESISHFYGDDKLDITKWIEEFEDTSQLLGWDNLQKLIYAKRLLTGSAKQFVSFQRDIKSWSRLKRCLMREFKTKINSATIHRQLINRKRQPSESARRDMYAMQEIASQGSIDTVSLIEYIISGVPDEETNKAILY